ncbi:alpha/beta fold hydrolase [Hymenobacter ruricola]|uniref:Alpha/beta fold hydrolase n=1 Tax=Hymenobacter ruricola TaxID=2791023 RepID=A0ABS0I766_9BACT|nr:alpha/beta fold hydrolase [Hymenobacter ruricola]MBF9222813.1 alpha/beta fold hydrolase [Hymenobacter ruricola]
MPYPLEQSLIATNGLRLHVARCGPETGPLVVLLHGFPEFWYAWRKQLEVLADAGYRVWAPDQRGYNLSDKPRRVRSYVIDELAADVVGLIDAAGCETAVVIGHDWGAAVAWHLAAHCPGRVSRVAILNVPHPRVLGRALLRKPGQLLKSWYVFFFQLPWLPEALVKLRRWRFARQALRGTSRRGTFSSADLARYEVAWAQPGAMRSMINWYRAAARFASRLGKTGRVSVPVRIIWGERDAFLRRELAQESLAYCDDAELTYLPASHWVQHEMPAEVNELLLRFLKHQQQEQT